MKISAKYVVVAVAISTALGLAPAAADPYKDESGHGYHNKMKSKEEYWDGNCKVERKWEGNGEYKEERKCRGRDYYYDRLARGEPYPEPEPTVVITLPPVVIR